MCGGLGRSHSSRSCHFCLKRRNEVNFAFSAMVPVIRRLSVLCLDVLCLYIYICLCLCEAIRRCYRSRNGQLPGLAGGEFYPHHTGRARELPRLRFCLSASFALSERSCPSLLTASWAAWTRTAQRKSEREGEK